MGRLEVNGWVDLRFDVEYNRLRELRYEEELKNIELSVEESSELAEKDQEYLLDLDNIDDGVETSDGSWAAILVLVLLVVVGEIPNFMLLAWDKRMKKNK